MAGAYWQLVDQQEILKRKERTTKAIKKSDTYWYPVSVT